MGNIRANWISTNVCLVFVTTNNNMILHNIKMKVRRVEIDEQDRFVGYVQKACEKERPSNVSDLVGALVADPGTSALTRGKINWIVEYDHTEHGR